MLGVQDLREDLATADSGDQRLVPDLQGRDPDDVFSDIPYEKGKLFLDFLEARFGRERFDLFLDSGRTGGPRGRSSLGRREGACMQAWLRGAPDLRPAAIPAADRDALCQRPLNRPMPRSTSRPAAAGGGGCNSEPSAHIQKSEIER